MPLLLFFQLKQRLESEPFTFWDGSQVIATVVPGNLGAFYKLVDKKCLTGARDSVNTNDSFLAVAGRACFNGHLVASGGKPRCGRVGQRE
jgi:hypothetical protein